MQPGEGRNRVVVEGVTPEIDSGKYPIKRIVGDKVVIEADVFADGHDALSCALLYRKETGAEWSEVPMEPLVNDRWRGAFTVQEIGRYRYTVCAWVDHFKSWSRDLAKRVQAGQDVSVDLLIGAEMVEAARKRATAMQAGWLAMVAEALRAGGAEGTRQALSQELARLMALHGERRFITTYDKELAVVVDRERARFGAWYELFPRSASAVPGRHGTLKDVEERLQYVAAMGFDVLYLPPIHPIGRSFRKGRNNSTVVGQDDPGSPWAIGSAEGGHKAIHPQLGTLADFRRLVECAAQYGIELALDIAFQCAPDHPCVTEHPEWFRRRPDGTIQYAENPPKKYQDIYPFDFETEHWRELWEELRSIAYSKSSEDRTNEVLVVVNLDPHYKQSGFITLPVEDLGIDARQPYQAHDLLTDARYLWHGSRNYVELNPQTVPAHIFVIRRKVRTEHDFDYYL